MEIKISKNPITSIIVGAGNRGMGYSRWALKNPDDFKIVGVVDPNHSRRKRAANTHGIPDEMCFVSVDALIKKGKIAACVINGTMDHLHIETSIPLLRAGYDMLLEKPISTSEEDLFKLLNVVRETKRKVMICHVLRFAPFYSEIKKRIMNGEIGEVFNIQTSEHVCYHHMSAAYIRGKWNNENICKSKILMAKCCHDLDLITWFMSGILPRRVSSFGSLSYFNKEHAPENSGTRCMVDCPIESNCDYSAKKLFIDNPDRWKQYVWTFIEGIKNPTIEDKINSLKTDNPHGRCVWKCDNNVYDRQSVIVEFCNGVTATHNLVGGAAKPNRKVHIIGSKGEIEGSLRDGELKIRLIDTNKDHTEEIVIFNDSKGMHGGGDLRLLEDFVKVLRGDEPSISTTNIEDSIYGHLIGFRADLANTENRVVNFESIE